MEMEESKKLVENDEEINLHPETLGILNEFLAEKNQNEISGDFSEDWQLSQFWYTEKTCEIIVNECISSVLCGSFARIACISCPSLLSYFMNAEHYGKNRFEVKLFEYDRRFQQRYVDSFVFYDYKMPLTIPEECTHSFDYIIVDPPFLSDECFVKVAQTIRILGKPDECKLLFCTGSVMEELLQRLFKVYKTTFRPMHKNNLANDFASFTNYKPKTL